MSKNLHKCKSQCLCLSSTAANNIASHIADNMVTQTLQNETSQNITYQENLLILHTGLTNPLQTEKDIEIQEWTIISH